MTQELGESMPAVDSAVFRRAVGRFASGVTVVTTVEGHIDHAMTANAFISVSVEPLLVLVSVEGEARFHDAVIDSGVWGVSVLDSTARPVADWLATRGRPLHGQLERVALHRGPVTGVALLDQSLATLECRTHAVHPGGDHSLVLGEVVAASITPGDREALLYYRSTFRRLA